MLRFWQGTRSTQGLEGARLAEAACDTARPTSISDEFKDMSLPENVDDKSNVPQIQKASGRVFYFSGTGFPAVSLTLPHDSSMLAITLLGKAT